MAGQAQNRDALTIAQHLRGDRQARVAVQNHDQIGHAHFDHAIAAKDEEFVLQIDPPRFPGMGAKPFQRHVANGKATFQVPFQIDNLGGHQQLAAFLIDHCLDRVGIGFMGVQHRAPQVQRLGDRAGDRGAFHEAAAHRLAGQTGGGAHGDDNRPRDAFQPDIIRRVADHYDRPLFIRHGRGAFTVAVDRPGAHLHFRKGAAHAVAIDHR